MWLLRLFVSVIAIAVLASLSGLTVAAEAPAQDKPGTTDSEVTLHIRELTIPPSDFWSPEYKAIYAKMVAGIREAASKPPQPDPHPARDASKDEWDKFDARVNGQAIVATFKRRGTNIPEALPDAFTPAFFRDPSKLQQWTAFVRDLSAEPPSFETVVSELAIFIGPPAGKAWP